MLLNIFFDYFNIEKWTFGAEGLFGALGFLVLRSALFLSAFFVFLHVSSSSCVHLCWFIVLVFGWFVCATSVVHCA